jgi:glutamine amidotransferase
VKAVAVVRLGVGNTASVVFALERLGARAVLTDDPAAVAEAERVILPGVSSAGWAMARIAELGLDEALRAFPRPLLGACLGQQLLYDSSAEGDVACLGLISGKVAKLVPAPDRPVPHMGWNRLTIEGNDPLLDGVERGAHAYFVHSFACPTGPETLASVDYGRPFAAVVRRGNVMGCQFHPERSAETGARILNNFLGLPC